MMKLVSAASILAIAGAAQGSPFNSLGFQGGGGLAGITGQGFTVANGFFFDGNGGAPNTSPSAPAGWTGANRFLEFDSYFCLDPFGPAARNRSTGTSNNSARTLAFYGDYGPPGAAAADYNVGEFATGYALTFGAGSHIGDPTGSNPASTPENRARLGVGASGAEGSGVPPVGSGFAPNATGGRSMLNGVFVGRLTVTTGAMLSGAIDFTILQTAMTPGGSETHELVLGGAAVSFMTHTGPQLLALRAYLVAGATRDAVDVQLAGLADPLGVNDGEPFGLADVYDLWVQVIPTPGALALVGLGGIAALRRRRA